MGDYQRVHQLEHGIDKYVFLRHLHVTKPVEFYRLLLKHAQEMLPFIYTPTVGQACQERHLLVQDGLPEVGLMLRMDRDAGRILQRLRELPNQNVKVIVVTDGERILGLGDLGANGIGISEGKISLYTVAAGVDPSVCLPVCLDVGTNNVELRNHPAYTGIRAPRPSEAEYHAFVKEFMDAIRAWQPHVLLQFEDFGNHTAFELLERYRGTHCCFNDDIQGTAAVCLSAVLAAMRVTGGSLEQQRVLFLGAGEAASGIAGLIAAQIARSTGGRVSLSDARKRCFLVDTKGLVCASRGADLADHKRPFAHDVPHAKDLKSAIATIKPTVLIGAAAMAGAFDEEVVRTMAALNERPIIMPLSNPTSKSECTFAQALAWTGGRVVFASGSPFDPLPHPVTGEAIYPTQANNAYVFPALGHAAVLAGARTIGDDVFMAAAEALAGLSTQEELGRGMLFPCFSRVRDESAAVMAACVKALVSSGAGRVPLGWEQKEGQGHHSSSSSSLSSLSSWRRAARAAMWGDNGSDNDNQASAAAAAISRTATSGTATATGRSRSLPSSLSTIESATAPSALDAGTAGAGAAATAGVTAPGHLHSDGNNGNYFGGGVTSRRSASTGGAGGVAMAKL